MMIRRSICSLLLSFSLANALMAQDSTALKLYCGSLDMTYGPAGWYAFNGDFALKKNLHLFQLKVYSENITSSLQSYSADNTTSLFNHSALYSDLLYPYRGIYRYSSLTLTYDFKMNDALDLNVQYTFNDKKLVATDTFYREWVTGLIPGSTMSGRDSVDYRYQEQLLTAVLKLYPTEKKKDVFHFEFEYNLPENRRSLSSRSQLFYQPDSLFQRMYNRENGSYQNREMKTGVNYRHYFKYSAIGARINYAQSNFVAHSRIQSVFSTDSVPYEKEYYLPYTGSRNVITAELSYSPDMKFLSRPEITYHYSDTRNLSYRYVDSLGSAVNDSLFASQTALQSTIHKISFRWNLSIRKFRIAFDGGYGSYAYSNEQTEPDSLTNILNYKNFNLHLGIVYETRSGKRFSSSFITAPEYASAEKLNPYFNHQMPFFWGSGHIFLQQEIKNSLYLDYHGNGSKNGTKLLVSLQGRHTQNAICPVGEVAHNDTTLSNGYIVPRGTVFYSYRNLDYEDMAQAYASLNIKTKYKFSIILSPLFNYKRIPVSANDTPGEMEHFTYDGQVSFSFSDLGRFRSSVNLRYQYHQLYNVIGTNYTGDFSRQSVTASIFYDIKKLKTLQPALSVQYISITGLSAGLDQSVLLISPRITFEPYEPKHYLVELELFDMLNQNNYFSRNATTLFVEDRRSTATGRTLFIRLVVYPGVLNQKKNSPK